MKTNILLGRKALNQTATSTLSRRKRPSFKWARIGGVKMKLSPAKYDELMAERITLRTNLEKHEEFLKDFASLFYPESEYMQCVEEFTSFDAERLGEGGLNAFSDDELPHLLARIQDFQMYSKHWTKALKPFAKLQS